MLIAKNLLTREASYKVFGTHSRLIARHSAQEGEYRVMGHEGRDRGPNDACVLKTKTRYCRAVGRMWASNDAT